MPQNLLIKQYNVRKPGIKPSSIFGVVY